MDTKTVLKVIAMLDQIIEGLNKEFDNSDLYGDQLDWIQGQIIGFKEFKEHLQGFIESQVNQVENDMNRGD
jgi:hypothetical protein